MRRPFGRGDLLYVLGEVHAGKNTLCHVALTEQHPNSQDLVEATEWDLASSLFQNPQFTGGPNHNGSHDDGVLRPRRLLPRPLAGAWLRVDIDCHPISELVLKERDTAIEVVSLRWSAFSHS